MPSFVPTVRPTGVPTCAPLTSRPTRNGQTNAPSSRPSSIPTADYFDYATSDQAYYEYYLDTKAAVTPPDANPADANTHVDFNTFNYKGRNIEGGCTDWNNFVAGQLSLPFSDLYISSVTSVMSYQPVVEQSTVFYNKSATCSNKDVMKRMLAAFLSGTMFYEQCDGDFWRVYTCSYGTIVCVNCLVSCWPSNCVGSAPMINPCNECVGKYPASVSASFGSFRFEISQVIFYPEFVVPLKLMNITKNSVRVQVNVSAVGVVYCAALSAAPSSVFSIQAAGVSVTAVDTAQLTEIILSGLLPEIQYQVYCYTEDFSGHIMPLATVLEAGLIFTTSCCRSLVFTRAIATISTSTTASATPDLFEFYIDARVTSPITVPVTIVPADCATGTELVSTGLVIPTAGPQSFIFSQDTPNLSGGFAVSTTSNTRTGCYKVKISVFDNNNIVAASVPLTVTSTAPVPAAPILTVLALANDGLSVKGTFAAATDRGASKGLYSTSGSSFRCTSLLTNNNITSTATCAWLSTTEFRVTLGVNTLAVGISRFNLLGDKVKPYCAIPAPRDCGADASNDAATVILSAPANPVLPVVSLSAPTTIGSCNDLSIDPTNSFGQASRSWQAVVWSVTATLNNANASVPSAVNMTAFLNSYFVAGTNDVVQIPYTFLQPGQYSIRLQLTNFLSASAVGLLSVTVTTSTSAPLVSIAGNNVLSMKRWQATSVFALASLPVCAQFSSQALQYSWKVFEDIVYVPELSQTESLDQRFFKLSPYRLKRNVQYSLQVTVTSQLLNVPEVSGGVAVFAQQNTESSTALISVVVGQSGVVALIAGGSSRTVSLTVSLVLDGSTSYSIDFPTDFSTLSYQWSCFTVAPIYGTGCGGVTSVNLKNAVITRQTVDLAPAVTYNYTLVVVSTDTGLVSSASTLITTVSQPLPVLNIPSSAPSKYDPSKKLRLSGSMQYGQVPQAVAVSWESLSELPDTLTSMALAPLQVSFATSSVTKTADLQLSLKAGVLEAGETYTFRISAYFSNDPTSIASIDISVLMNEAPRNGVLVVTPTEGEALTTLFSLRTSGWLDDPEDIPLQYSMSSYTQSVIQASSLRAASTMTYLDGAILPQGLSSMDFVVTCIVSASDTFGASGTAQTVAVVVPATDPIGALAENLDASLSEAFAETDASMVSQVIGSATAALNAVDCDNMPAGVNCNQLHRSSCENTPNTCGPCKSNFFGVEGDSNTLCAPSGQARRLLLDGARRLDEELFPLGAPCEYDSMCMSTYCFQSAAPELRVCSELPKACANNCTFEGACTFYDSANAVISFCGSGDSFCSAQCRCFPGQYGHDCSLTEAEHDSVRRSRELLCVGLYQTMFTNDATTDAILSTANSAASVLKDSSQLTPYALMNCTRAVTKLVVTHADLLDSDEAVDAVFAALSTSFTAALAPSTTSDGGGASADVPESFMEEVAQAAVTLMSARQGFLSVGEEPTSLVSSTLRMLTGKQLSDDFASGGQLLTIPQSAYEAFNGFPAAQLTVQKVQSATGGANDPVGVSLVQLTKSTHVRDGEAISSGSNSSSVWLSTQLYGAEENPEAFISTVVLQNREPLFYASVDPVSYEVDCERSADRLPFTQVLACPYAVGSDATNTYTDVYDFAYQCPGDRRGGFNITCPSTQEKPRCMMWNDEDREYMVNPLCRVVAFTAFNTTCECSLTGSYSARARRLASGDGGLFYTEIYSALGVSHSIADSTFRDFRDSDFVRSRVAATSTGAILVLLLLSLYNQWHHMEGFRVVVDKGNGRYSSAEHASEDNSEEVSGEPAAQASLNGDECDFLDFGTMVHGEHMDADPTQDLVLPAPEDTAKQAGVGESNKLASLASSPVGFRPPARDPFDETEGGSVLVLDLEKAAPASRCYRSLDSFFVALLPPAFATTVTSTVSAYAARQTVPPVVGSSSFNSSGLGCWADRLWYFMVKHNDYFSPFIEHHLLEERDTGCIAGRLHENIYGLDVDVLQHHASSGGVWSGMVGPMLIYNHTAGDDKVNAGLRGDGSRLPMVKWARVCLRVLNILFLSSVLVALAYGDSECVGLKSEADCLTPTFGLQKMLVDNAFVTPLAAAEFGQCRWDAINHNCETIAAVSDVGASASSDALLLAVVVMITVVLVVSIPANILLNHWLLEAIRCVDDFLPAIYHNFVHGKVLRHTHSAPSAASAEAKQRLRESVDIALDELDGAQSSRWKLFLAGRLALMQLYVDNDGFTGLQPDADVDEEMVKTGLMIDRLLAYSTSLTPDSSWQPLISKYLRPSMLSLASATASIGWLLGLLWSCVCRAIPVCGRVETRAQWAALKLTQLFWRLYFFQLDHITELVANLKRRVTTSKSYIAAFGRTARGRGGPGAGTPLADPHHTHNWWCEASHISLYRPETTCRLLRDSVSEHEYGQRLAIKGRGNKVLVAPVTTTASHVSGGDSVVSALSGQSGHVSRGPGSTLTRKMSGISVKRKKKIAATAQADHGSASSILSHYLKSVSREAGKVGNCVDHIALPHHRELYLMREFILHSVGTVSTRVVASKYMWSAGPQSILDAQASTGGGKRKHHGGKGRRHHLLRFGCHMPWLFPLLAVVGLTLYVMSAVACIFVYGMGSRSWQTAGVWVAVALVALIEDICAVVPSYVFVVWMGIPAMLSRELNGIKDLLYRRFNFVMRRTSGVVQNNSVHSLIQHFHPVCRAARLFPELPVARFLISLNDYDTAFPVGMTACGVHCARELNLPMRLADLLTSWVVMPCIAVMFSFAGPDDGPNAQNVWMLHLLLIAATNAAMFLAARLLSEQVHYLVAFVLVILAPAACALLVFAVQNFLPCLATKGAVVSPYDDESSASEQGSMDDSFKLGEGTGTGPARPAVLYTNDGLMKCHEIPIELQAVETALYQKKEAREELKQNQRAAEDPFGYDDRIAPLVRVKPSVVEPQQLYSSSGRLISRPSSSTPLMRPSSAQVVPVTPAQPPSSIVPPVRPPSTTVPPARSSISGMPIITGEPSFARPQSSADVFSASMGGSQFQAQQSTISTPGSSINNLAAHSFASSTQQGMHRVQSASTAPLRPVRTVGRAHAPHGSPPHGVLPALVRTPASAQAMGTSGSMFSNNLSHVMAATPAPAPSLPRNPFSQQLSALEAEAASLWPSDPNVMFAQTQPQPRSGAQRYQSAGSLGRGRSSSPYQTQLHPRNKARVGSARLGATLRAQHDQSMQISQQPSVVSATGEQLIVGMHDDSRVDADTDADAGAHSAHEVDPSSLDFQGPYDLVARNHNPAAHRVQSASTMRGSVAPLRGPALQGSLGLRGSGTGGGRSFSANTRAGSAQQLGMLSHPSMGMMNTGRDQQHLQHLQVHQAYLQERATAAHAQVERAGQTAGLRQFMRPKSSADAGRVAGSSTAHMHGHHHHRHKHGGSAQNIHHQK